MQGAVLDEVILGKRLFKEKRGGSHNLLIALGVLLAILSMIVLNNFFHLHTFYVTALFIFEGLALMWRKRPDLISNSILSRIF